MSAYVLVYGTQSASGSRGAPVGAGFNANDQSFRILESEARRRGVQVAAQKPETPVISDAQPERPVDKAAAATSQTPAQPQSRMKLSGVERIRLRVWGNPDFNGEYGIDPDMTLSLPWLGRLDLTDHTSATLEQLIAERLSASLRRETRVSLEVVKSRPFFIMGQISKPGAMEWRPGLTLVQAIALAGGVTRNAGDAGGLRGDQVTRSQLTYAVAQLSRLRIEKGELSNTYTLTSSTDNEKPMMLGDMLTVGQKTMLDEQRAIFQSRISNLDNERRSALREAKTAREQIKALGEQMELSRQASKDLEYLKEKRLIANRMYLSQRTELSTIESKSSDMKVVLERAENRAESMQRQILLMKQERQAQLSDRIEALEKDIVALKTRLGGDDTPGGKTRGIEFFVARNLSGDFDVKPVTIFGEVNPGDVVIVISRGQGEPDLNSKSAMMQWVLEASAQLPGMAGATSSPDLGSGSTLR